MADAPPSYNQVSAQQDNAKSPLLDNQQQPIIQPVVVQPPQQQIVYQQQPQQQVVYVDQNGNPVQQPQQPQQQVVYVDQNGNPIQQQQQVPQYVQQSYQQPTYQQQQGTGQVVVQPQIQPASTVPQQTGSHNPSDQQLGEGLPVLPILVAAPKQATVVGAPKDGVGMSEGCARNPHIFTWILTIGLWYVIFSGAICGIVFRSSSSGYCGSVFGQIGPFFGIFGAVAIIYLIECCCSGTGKYLSNILQKEGASGFVDRVKGQPAVIWWRVACYHWETRRRSKRVTDANGNTRTEWETHREKVYTWRAREQYQYGTCIDVSGDLVGLDEWKLTKLRLRKTFGFLDVQSQMDYSRQLRTFRAFNWRDMHQEFYEEFTIPGFIDRILAESEPGVKPGWMNAGMFWLCNLIGFSPCFRTAMAAKCGNVEYTFIKQLSATRL